MGVNATDVKKSAKILKGKTEICIYAGFGRAQFSELIERGFPAVFYAGAWRAHVENVDAFMRSATRPRGPQHDIPEDDELVGHDETQKEVAWKQIENAG